MSVLKIKDMMTCSYTQVSSGTLLLTLQEQLKDHGWEAVVFRGEDGKPEGIISREAILQVSRLQKVNAEKTFTLVKPLIISEEAESSQVIALLMKGNAGCLVQDEAGNLTGVITLDILVGKLFRGWQKSQAQFETILQYASEAICIINDREEVEYWNPRAEILYSIRMKEILGQKISKFFSNVMVSQALSDRRIVKERYHQPREGAHVLITSAPITIGERIIGSLSLERDIADVVYLNEELSRTSFKVNQLKNEINRLSKSHAFARIYGHSIIIKETINMAKKFAATDTSLLIRGESGTGKELFAEAIHEESSRCEQAFVAVNCGALPQMLFESEVFGYEGGAFTGAFKEGRPGKFELADGGTLFLDEIGELELGAQVKLLRVLQEKVFYRVGGTKPIKVNVRIIAATNRDLEKMIEEGRFREDLYYRLNVINLSLPPLRERKEDLPELVYLLTQELSAVHQKKNVEFEPAVMVAFMNYNWPGNVRQLRNVLERLVILADDRVIKQENLPDFLRLGNFPELVSTSSKGNGKLPEVTGQTERQMILDALGKAAYNKAEAARILGIPRGTLYYKMKVLGIVLEN